MTRSSQNNPVCIMTSHIKQARKNGGGGNYPQWMRTLEEKYQKLHKKIAENTGVGYGRFNSCVGRSVYDARLSQALLRYKDQAIHKATIRSKLTPNDTVTNNQTRGTDLCGEDKIEPGQNQYLDNEIDLQNGNNVKNCEKTELEKTESPTCGLVLQSTSNEKLEDENSDLELIDFNDSGSVGYNKNDINARNGKLHVDKHVFRKKDDVNKVQEVNNNHQYNRKYLKTSVSRTSKITSKSCPAKIQHKTLENVNQKRLLNSRSKSANRNDKMFTPMSEEAKHAITETIHEMNLSTTDKVKRPDTVQFIPSRGRKCVKSWGIQKKSRSFFDIHKVEDDASQCLEDFHSDGVNLRERQSEDDDDKVSCQSSAGSIVDQRSTSRLPDIQTGSARDRGSVRNSSYRLPGIGKYDIAQDDPVFEITPPGFDSRYNDVLVVEERESETPPPDIRQRAIDKCAEWLNKYNK